MRSEVLKRVDKVKRGRGRPKLTWDESVKRDLKDWDISEELALDRSAWRLLSTCLNHDLCAFWVLFLVYPNSLGTIGYVVVVVVAAAASYTCGWRECLLYSMFSWLSNLVCEKIVW